MNRSLKKRISAYLLTGVLTLASIGNMSVFAAEKTPFQDVLESASYAEGVQYVYNKGIASGTSATTFSPDRQITFGELSVMLCRAYWPNKTWTFDEATNWVVNKQMELFVDPVAEQKSLVSRSAAYHAVFACLKAPVYGKSLYEPQDEESGNQNDAYIYTAFRMGLCSEETEPLELVTRGEVAELLYKISQNTLTIDPPLIMKRTHAIIEDEYLVRSNLYFTAASSVPESILDQFETSGWTFVIGDDRIIQFNEENNMTATGLTSYAKKTIYACNARSVVHEFGHFLSDQLSAQELEIIKQLYNSESEQAEPVIGSYSTTNDGEYFAEFFEKWISWKNNSTKRQMLKSAAPQTYMFFEQLEAQDWVSSTE